MSCCYCLPGCFCLENNEQKLLRGFTTSEVRNGPGCFCVGCCLSGTNRQAVQLLPNQYAVVRDIRTQQLKIESGPQSYFLDAYEELPNRATSDFVTLAETQYLITSNKATGQLRLYIGPNVWRPADPFEDKVGGAQDAITLSATQYIIVRDEKDGRLELVKGPSRWFPPSPYVRLVGKVREAISLSPTQYLIIFNEQDGTLRAVNGPCVWFPGDPFETIKDGVRDAISLKSNEYIRILDTGNGNVRVERGEKLVTLTPTETLISGTGKKGGVETAVNIDSQTAVVVRNTKNGQVDLITRKGLFFPGPYEVIESVQKKIILQDQHTIILRDQAGNYHFKAGNRSGAVAAPVAAVEAPVAEEPSLDRKKSKKLKGKGKEDEPEEFEKEIEGDRAFFLPPFWEIVELNWSVGPYKDKKRAVSVIDQRGHQMSYVFVTRTADSVELELDINFYWQITDVPKMITRTQDPTGDICFHARSVISGAVSRMTLDKFMHGFNSIVSNAVLALDDDFYEQRGLKIHNCEVRGMHCKDPRTEEVLQEIIKETTNRLNRLQKQTSENEVQMLQMKGDIEKEKVAADLIKVRQANKKLGAISEGESEAAAVAAFLERFGVAQNMDAMTAIQLWQSLRQKESVSALANGNAQLFVTPDAVNLAIGAGAVGGIPPIRRK